MSWAGWAALAVLAAGALAVLLTRTAAWKRFQLRRASMMAAADRVDDMVRFLDRNRSRRSVVDPLSNALVYFLIRAGRLDEAEKVVTEAIEKGDRSGTALGQLGFIAAGRGDHAGAEELYRRAMERDPALKPTLSVNLAGMMIERRERLDEAEALLEQALEGREGSSRSGVHLNLSMLEMARGRHREALVHALTAHGLIPAAPVTRGVRAQALALAARAALSMGDAAECRSHADRALELVADLPGFDRLRAELETMREKPGR